MCFSSTASFGAGAVLSVIGIASLRKARTTSQVFFASIPLIFCVQQISEGFVWLVLSDPAYASVLKLCSYAFVIFARVVWPTWLPFAIMKLEVNAEKKTIQQFLAGTGVVVSLFAVYCLFVYPVEPSVTGLHITYEQHVPEIYTLWSGLFYVLATIVPHFISTVKRMWIFGSAILISYILTHIFYHEYVISVWCFFASLISLIVYVIMQELSKSQTSTRRADTTDLTARRVTTYVS